MFFGGAHGWNIDIVTRHARVFLSTASLEVRNGTAQVLLVFCTLLGPEGPEHFIAFGRWDELETLGLPTLVGNGLRTHVGAEFRFCLEWVPPVF